MLTNKSFNDQSYTSFIERAVKSSKVWFLAADDGNIAITESNDYEDTGVILVWADAADARNNAKEEWAKYKAVEIDLVTFLEYHIITLSNDDMLLGINFDQNMFGMEVEPLTVALDIIDELKDKDKSPAFKHHKDMAEYERITIEALESMLPAEGEEVAN